MRTDSDSQLPTPGWTVRRAVLWAGFPFALGLTLGILARRAEVAASTKTAAGEAQHSTESAAEVRQGAPDRVKLMADQQAQPLLAQLKSTPNDPELLAKLGNIYYVTKSFKEASAYFKRSVDIRDDVKVRTELGRAYYYSGDPDDALAQFEKVLKSDPDNANAMFNVGMVKWQGKFDVDGALAAWQQILKKYPNHPRRAEVEQLIARAKQHRALQQPVKLAQPPI
jgi:cytochrome c-type biogenesis protein CcmH/NrfG